MTTLAVGGPARFFVDAQDEAAIVRALSWAREQGVDVVVLGGGSNVVIADRGLDALVLKVSVPGVEVQARGAEVVVSAAAGEAWDALVARGVASDWAGVECLSGIPGAVGATPIQNVGAYGQDVSETIRSVRVIDRASLAPLSLSAEACRFGYRDSVFKRERRDRYVVVGVTFALRRGGAPAVRYPELARRLGAASSPRLLDVRRAVLELRRAKSMVIDQADENRRSVGSFFVNPTVASVVAGEARARAERLGLLAAAERMPEYPGPEGSVKLSAAWLIERSGFTKGISDGAVGISTRHSLAIVNRGGATAQHVVAFAARVRRAVRDRFGIALVPEAQLLGFLGDETRELFEL